MENMLCSRALTLLRIALATTVALAALPVAQSLIRAEEPETCTSGQTKCDGGGSSCKTITVNGVQVTCYKSGG
jgi:hypothetical protein